MYGAFIIDPNKGRPDADELVMVMNGFDTNFDLANEVYAVNTVGFAYMDEPIRVSRNELVRIYLVNVLEFDPINSLHVHANFFHYFPTGTSLEPVEFTDTIMQCQGQRGILELRFPHKGQFMFHAHQSEFAQLGWMGLFEVTPDGGARRDARAPGRAGRLPAWLLGADPAAADRARGRRVRAAGRPRARRPQRPAGRGARRRAHRARARRIKLSVRNDGPDAVTLAQVIVNDGFADFTASDAKLGRLETAKVAMRYPWIEGSAYNVQILTSTGATIEHEIPVAVETPEPDVGFYGLMALLGFYVGVLPVTLGMLWLPFVRRIDPRWLRVLMALTIGLLGFLAIDATLEGLDVAGEGSQALGGTALVFVGGPSSLPGADRRRVLAQDRRSEARDAAPRRPRRAPRRDRDRAAQPRRGARDRVRLCGRRARARGVPGDRLRAAQHDRGARDRRARRRGPPPGAPRLLGVIAGAPAILGAWIGASAFNSSLAALLLGRRRRRDRAGDPAARAVDPRPRRARCSPGERRGHPRRLRDPLRDEPPGERVMADRAVAERAAAAPLRGDRELCEGDLRARAARRGPSPTTRSPSGSA